MIDVKRWNFGFDIDIIDINSFHIDIYWYWFLPGISDTSNFFVLIFEKRHWKELSLPWWHFEDRNIDTAEWITIWICGLIQWLSVN